MNITATPTVDGVKVVKLPSADLARAVRWYVEVFGAEPELEFADDDGVVRGVSFLLPGSPAGLALRHDPAATAGFSGFNPVSWAVADRPDIERWMDHLDAVGVEHSPVIEATVGWLLIFRDPDGIEHHLYTTATHGIDHGSSGYGRPYTGAHLATA